MIRTVVTTVAAATLISCYSGSGADTRPLPTSRTLITRAELDRLASVDLLEAVRSLRPLWLVSRSRDGRTGFLPTSPRLWVDNVPYGGIDRLREVPLDQVIAIRFFTAIDATTRWGTGVPAGAIEVITGRRR